MSIPSRAAAGLALAVLSASVGTSAANVALPALGQVFTDPAGHEQWVVVAYLLTMTAASVVVGSLGDRFGRKRVLIAGIATFTLGAAIAALSPSLAVLIAARALQGVGAAVMTAMPLALARDLGAERQTGRVMGLLGTTSAVGTALGPVIGGVLIGWFGWSAAFWIMVPLGVLSLFMTSAIPAPDELGSPRRRFDLVGSVLLTAGIAAYALAVTSVTPAWLTVPVWVMAAVLLGGFLEAERRAENPVLPRAALRDRVIGTGMITNILVATVMMATLVVGPYALHNGLGLPLPFVGLVMAVGPVTSAVSGILAGRLVDRTSPAAMITISLTVMTIGAGLLAALPAIWGVAGYVIALLVLTPGYQLFLAANNTHVIGSADGSLRGTIAGALGLSRNLGLITGAAAMGGLYAALAVGHSDAVTGAMDAMLITFAVASLLAATAALTSLLTLHRHNPARKEHR